MNLSEQVAHLETQNQMLVEEIRYLRLKVNWLTLLLKVFSTL